MYSFTGLGGSLGTGNGGITSIFAVSHSQLSVSVISSSVSSAVSG